MTFQLLALAVVNLVVIAVAWSVNEAESRPGFPGLPLSFIAPEIFIFLSATLLCSLTGLAQGANAVFEESLEDPVETERIVSENDGFRAWWLAHRVPYLRAGVIGLSALMVFALDRLVHSTGGGLRSPFMPLLEAPAVLGPFIARKWEGLVLSVGAVSIAIGIEIQTRNTAAVHADYGPTAHTVVTLLVVLVAGLISAVQKRRKSRKRKKAANSV